MITQAITLKHGFMVGGNAHKDIVLREPTLGDMMATGGVFDHAVDPEAAARLWRVSEELTGVKLG